MNEIINSLESGLNLPDSLRIGVALTLGVVCFLVFLLIAGLSYVQLPKLLETLVNRLSPQEAQGIYQSVIQPHQNGLGVATILVTVDLILLSISDPDWLEYLEIPLGLVVGLTVTVMGFRIFKDLFDKYLLEIALEDHTKINSDLLVLGQVLSKAAIVLVVIFIFAQTHAINLIGLIASLSVAGAAVAFGSQKVIEQILWSIVLYIDQPFTVDEYIHLPDRTMGRVESVGWRSTKIRLSGKNTLVIVPNSNLAQVSIENLTRAKRVISMVNLTFLRSMTDEEKALIHQLILGSTSDILGIDHRLTQVTLKDSINEQAQEIVEAQVIFFILGTTEISFELRKGLLEIARENILRRLREFGINFDLEQETLDFPQSMNI